MTDWSISRWLLACALLAGCLPSGDPPPPHWHYLHAAIIQPSCATAGCHSKLTALAGVDLADAEGAYFVLTGTVCGSPPPSEKPPRNFITPGSSEYSTLMYQLRGADAAGRPFRNVMPRDTRLPAVEVDLIASWIDGGAPCD